MTRADLAIYEQAKRETIQWFIQNGAKYNFDGIHYLVSSNARTLEESIDYFISEMNRKLNM